MALKFKNNPTKQGISSAAECTRINNEVKYRKSYLKLYLINKEPHPENLKQSHKIDYPAYQSNRRLVNTFKGMENSGVISHYLKEIVHEEAMQII